MFKKFVLILSIPFVSLKAQPPKSYSSSEILLQLKKLNTVGSVLYIAAHPDDENTRLLSYLANKKCLRTAYLSLTRGDGGQNLIGPEQGVELGLIRTQELYAARRIDGAEQFFTRAYDFGFSKTPDETFDKWNHDSILADMVWIIRHFKPDIIITRFATDGSGGHGHHTASALLAEEAFDAAADPSRFSEQLKDVSVWKTKRMFQNSTARFRDPKADMSKFLKLDVGVYNSLLGKSYGEIAAESRSMHKSQGFGSAKQRGAYFEYFKPLKGDTFGLKEMFEGMDFTWKSFPGGEAIGILCEKAVRNFEVQNPEKILPDLLKIKQSLSKLENSSYKRFKETLLNNVMLAVLGVAVDLVSSSPQINIGGRNKLTLTIVNRSSFQIEIEDIFISGALADRQKSIDSAKQIVLQPNQPFVFNFYSDLRFVRSTQVTSQPYWLHEPPNGRFKVAKEYIINANPMENSSVYINFKLKNLTRGAKTKQTEWAIGQSYPIQYRWVDPEKGELYRPLVITPPVILKIQNGVYVFPDAQSKEIKVLVQAEKDSLQGILRLKLPQGWLIQPPDFQFNFLKKGDEKTYSFLVTPPHAISEVFVKATAEVNGSIYSKAMHEIKYDHIAVQTWFPEAETKAIRLDVVRSKKRIGYIPGAGDEVQNCLTQLGYEVVTITDAMLANDPLGAYEAIITGVRAYNTNENLFLAKQKLMDYVAQGGNLIVQYNTNSFSGPLRADIGPKPFKITRDRVTDEHAEITFEMPDHQVLNSPNKIRAMDFDGWVQERGIYFAGEMDSAYQCPISLSDKGEKGQKGSLIVCKHGKGNFMYTGLVFFRQLPAGVSGAFRLMVNMIEMN